MARLGRLLRQLQFFLRREQFQRELEEEMRLHAELRAAALREKQGVDAGHAARLARKRFGNAGAIGDESRDAWSFRWLEEAFHDMGFGLRQMGKSPGSTTVAVLSLALGIGANTAIFTTIESVLLRAIAVRDVDQLRLLTWRSEEARRGWVAANLGYRSPTYGWFYEQRLTADGAYVHAEFPPSFFRQALQDNTVFESLFGFKELGRVTAVADRSAEPVNAFLISGGFYRGVQVSPILGRAIGQQDEAANADSVAVISYDYWTRRFNRSPSVLGKTIYLNDAPATIVGVNPEYFTGIVPGGHFEVWAPLNLWTSIHEQSPFDDDIWRIQMMGRLKPGVSDTRAQAAMDAIFQGLLDARYRNSPGGAKLQDPAKRPKLILKPGARGVDYVTDHYGRMLMAVLALAGMVLLIACANVANLLLAKSAARQPEISLRLALGARRVRIVRQLLAECLPLAALAGLLGLVIGYFTRNGIPKLLAAPWKANPYESAFDAKVLLVSIGVTFLTGILFSLAPAWQTRRVDWNDALKEGGRGAKLSRLRLGGVLVALQIALSVVLLVGAGLCVRTFTNLNTSALGVRPEGVVLFAIEPPRLRYNPGRLASLLASVQERVASIPGVQAASFSDEPRAAYVSPSNQPTEQTYENYVPATAVTSNFFAAMGIPILYGRAIDHRDGRNGTRAVVVNQEFARRVFQRENCVGETFTATDATGGAEAESRQGLVQYQIVGVSADWRTDNLHVPVRASLVSSWAQMPHAGRANFQVRIAQGATAGAEARVVRLLREAVRSADPNLAVVDVRMLTADIQDSLSQERLMASLATVFGALALVLASIGTYGVVAYSVARRTHEIGVRVALGARPRGIAWMVLRKTLMLAAAGIAIGLPTVLALGPMLDRALAPPYVEQLAYGTKLNDPRTLVAVVLTLTMVTFLAGYLPARRAAKVDAMTALRHD